VCVGIDDGDIERLVLRATLFSQLGADVARSAVVGETEAEQRSFVDLAFGRVDAQLQPVPEGEWRQADIAVLDNEINTAVDPPILGTVLAARLREEGFGGVIGLLTSSPGSAGPHVDVVWSKGGNLKQLASTLQAKLQERQGGSLPGPR